MSVVITLKTPIQAHGEEVSEITLREPTTEGIIEIGLPTLMVVSEDGSVGGVEVRQKVIARYIMKLAAIPMSSVKALSVADFSTAQAGVMGFFGIGSSAT